MQGALSIKNPGWGGSPPWVRDGYAHQNRVLAAGGSNVNLEYVISRFKLKYDYNLNLGAWLSPAFGSIKDAQGRVTRLFELSGKDLLLEGTCPYGCAVVPLNGIDTLIYTGAEVYKAIEQSGYNPGSGDMISYCAIKPASYTASSVYAKSFLNSVNGRYSWLYLNGVLPIWHDTTSRFPAVVASPWALNTWRVASQQAIRSIPSQSAYEFQGGVLQQVGAAVAIDATYVMNASYAFFLGGYNANSNTALDASRRYTGAMQEILFLRTYPGAATNAVLFANLASHF
ncbi:hypothetical protein I2I05_18925 [Hymenobacter sp. BT683]|uniref:Uncharacterized protein n=1 Tax=Hymenobacter jeongseonensis TaxID=2791027 RepID=A0ABS0IM75_9BACT|nr:hypothetical protein [Hymenobacter jeongseonensis]MBF9239474.1 hypothetical protein [Hymenobacter jeongseonensis]